MSSPCRHFYTSEGLSSSPVQAADLLFLYTSACLRRFASLDMLPPIRTPAPLSAAPCSLGGVSEGLSSLVRAAVLLILPHVSAASRLSTCSPNSHSRAAQRRSLLIGGRVGRSLLLPRASRGFSYTSACLRRFAPLDMLPQFALPRRSAPLPAHWGGVSEGLSSSHVRARRGGETFRYWKYNYAISGGGCQMGRRFVSLAWNA